MRQHDLNKSSKQGRLITSIHDYDDFFNPAPPQGSGFRKNKNEIKRKRKKCPSVQIPLAHTGQCAQHCSDFISLSLCRSYSHKQRRVTSALFHLLPSGPPASLRSDCFFAGAQALQRPLRHCALLVAKFSAVCALCIFHENVEEDLENQ